MARRSILGRIRDLFRRAPAPEPPPPEQPPPRPPPPPEPPPRDDKERAYRQAWIEETLERPGRRYRQTRAFFEQLPLMYSDEQEEYDTWRTFLANMVRSGGTKRNDIRNEFWQATGLNPNRDFDWDGFRRIMAGSPKTRRRG